MDDLPNVLLTSTTSKDDIAEIRVWLLWNKLYPDKPFDRNAAYALQRRLRFERKARREKEAKKLAKQKQKQDKAYQDLVQKIASVVFDVNIFSDDVDNDNIDWDTKIRDKISGQVVGTPMSLLNDDGGVNLGLRDIKPDARKDLGGYVASLRQKYDEFSQDFSFERPSRNVEPVRLLATQGGSFAEPSPFFRFTLKVTWRPLNRREIEKRVKSAIRNLKVHA